MQKDRVDHVSVKNMWMKIQHVLKLQKHNQAVPNMTPNKST